MCPTPSTYFHGGKETVLALLVLINANRAGLPWQILRPSGASSDKSATATGLTETMPKISASRPQPASASPVTSKWHCVSGKCGSGQVAGPLILWSVFSKSTVFLSTDFTITNQKKCLHLFLVSPGEVFPRLAQFQGIIYFCFRIVKKLKHVYFYFLWFALHTAHDWDQPCEVGQPVKHRFLLQLKRG